MGKLTVVGIGPGDYENMTVRADRALARCDTIIGYHVYVAAGMCRSGRSEHRAL